MSDSSNSWIAISTEDTICIPTSLPTISYVCLSGQAWSWACTQADELSHTCTALRVYRTNRKNGFSTLVKTIIITLPVVCPESVPSLRLGKCHGQADADSCRMKIVGR